MGLIHLYSSFTMISPSDRWRRRSSPPAQADRVMKTSPLAGYIVIVPSDRRRCSLSLGWGKGTPTPSVGSSFLAQIVAKVKNISFCLGPLTWNI